MRAGWWGGIVALALATGCRGEPGALVLEVDHPAYGAFLGEGPVVVSGRVSRPNAAVSISGVSVPVAPDGRFLAVLPLDDPFRVVDVQARTGWSHERVRIPVFRGGDPLETWPGALTLRVTPAGLDRLGENLGALVDATGWSTLLLEALPSVETSLVSLRPTELTRAPTVVELQGAEDGIDTVIRFRDVTVHMELEAGSLLLPLQVGFESIRVGALATPEVDGEGMLSVSLSDATLRMDEAVVVVGDLDGWLLAWLLDAALWLVAPLGEWLLDLVLESWGYLPLGGPYAFATDLLGLTVAAQLAEVKGDPDGLAAGVGMGLDAPAGLAPLGVPVPAAGADGAHLVVGLHEALLHSVVAGQVGDLLAQRIELPGLMGEILGNGIRMLPGGHAAPAGEGWCVAMDPGKARVVRLQDGLAPWAVLYLPDMTLDIGILQPGGCEPWLVASMASEVGLVVSDGTRVKVDMDFVEGAVMRYETSADWDEDEVVAGLGAVMGGLTTLLGAAVEIDLADLLGGFEGDGLLPGLDGLSPRLLSSEPLLDEDGSHPEGLYAVGVGLFEE